MSRRRESDQLFFAPGAFSGAAAAPDREPRSTGSCWNALEKTLVEISPQFGGFFKLMFDNAGKDKDPNFDMRRELVGNLGDDFITYQKNPKGNSLAELNSPPSLFLIGSSNAEKLAGAIKMVASLLPPIHSGNGC